MNGKRIAKIISEELLVSLKQFSDVISKSYELIQKEEGLSSDYERRSKYNKTVSNPKYRKIDPLKFGGYDKLGFDIEISEPLFNLNLRDKYRLDSPYLTVRFSNLSNRSVDPKTIAKIILFGFSTDWIYKVRYDDDSDKLEYSAVIDYTEFGSNFNEINVFFVREVFFNEKTNTFERGREIDV